MSPTLQSISLGPVSVPLGPVVLLAAVWSASWVASQRVRRQPGGGVTPVEASNTVTTAALLGLLAARLAHLAWNAQAYLSSPWAALDVRDGGWHAPTGVVAGLAWLAWTASRRAALRRPLAVSAVFGLVAWLGAGAFLAPPVSTLPVVALTDLDDGRSLTLAEAAQGRPVVVNLWASWCGPCRHEMPVFAAAQRREHGVGILFANQGESEAAVRAYLVDQGLDLRHVLLDRSSSVGKAVGSRGLPTTLFYDARGRLVDAHVGVLNAAALEARLRALGAR